MGIYLRRVHPMFSYIISVQRFVFIGNELKDTEVLFSCPRDGFLHLALNAVVAIVRPCGVGVPGPPGYGDIGGGGAIGLIMSDGSRGFPFTRMKPPGAAAAVKPLAEGIILRERRKGRHCCVLHIIVRETSKWADIFD